MLKMVLMIQRNKLILFLIGLVLIGCNTIIKKEDVGHPTSGDTSGNADIASSASPPKIVMAMPPPKPAEASIPAPAARDSVYSATTTGGSIVKDNVLYKSFLLPAISIDKKQFVNLVYFPRKPITKKEFDQYVFICKVWSNMLPNKDEIAPYVKKEQLIPLYWSLTKATNPELCEALVTNYDYVRMQVFISVNKLDKDKIQLIGIYNNVYVSMNLTKLSKEEDIVLAFDVWKSKMSKVPEKTTDIDIFTMVDSAKKVLGALAGLIITGFKG